MWCNDLVSISSTEGGAFSFTLSTRGNLIRTPESVLTLVAPERATTKKAKKSLNDISPMGKTDVLASTVGTPYFRHMVLHSWNDLISTGELCHRRGSPVRAKAKAATGRNTHKVLDFFTNPESQEEFQSLALCNQRCSLYLNCFNLNLAVAK
jgi:hypothetical protein